MACTQILSGIQNDCSTSMGGISTVYIANYADVTSVTASTDKITAITMSSSAKFKQYEFKKGTGSMTSTLTVDPANGINYVTTDLVLAFSRMETAKRIEVAALALGELAVIVKDCNGVYWYLGKDEPVVSSAGTGETGTARSDGNKYTVTLQDTSLTYPYEIQVGDSGVNLDSLVG